MSAPTYHPWIRTRHGEVIWTALRDETGYWRKRGDGYRFFLEPNEPYCGIHLRFTGMVTVHGRLADKVAHLPGARAYDHIGYIGWAWQASR